VLDGRCVVVRGPRENQSRPAIDPLFRSAAAAFGGRTVGVVLSGARDDGVAGAAAISRIGGTVIVRDPEEADFADNDIDDMSIETRDAALDRQTIESGSPPRDPSVFACPACGGVLWEVDEDDGPPRFRCRVGHAYTLETALDEQSEEVDRALWAAYRALQERAELSERLVARLGASPTPTHGRLESAAREAREQAELIRTVLLERDARSG
jgi:two-component system chemotaxis response regulator CheB